MTSSSYDTSKLLVPFTNCPKNKKLVDFFPELKIYKQFTQQQDDNVIRIAILTSDADSPFWKLRSDRESMISAIFDFLEIGRKNKIGQSFYESVLNYKHPGVSECWSAYLQMQYNVDFNDWVISKETYDMLIDESVRPRGESEDAIAYSNWRIKIRNEIRKIGEDLKQIEPKIFKDSKMVQPVAIAEKKIKNYPEKYAITDSLM